MDGSLAGTRAWFGNPASQVSAHRGFALNGSEQEYVKPGDRAWANGVLEAGNRWGIVCAQYGLNSGVNPNDLTLAWETEDLGNNAEPVSDALYARVRDRLRAELAAGLPLKVITTHSVVSPQSRPSCPGHRWTDGRLQQLGRDCGLPVFV